MHQRSWSAQPARRVHSGCNYKLQQPWAGNAAPQQMRRKSATFIWHGACVVVTRSPREGPVRRDIHAPPWRGGGAKPDERKTKSAAHRMTCSADRHADGQRCRGAEWVDLHGAGACRGTSRRGQWADGVAGPPFRHGEAGSTESVLPASAQQPRSVCIQEIARLSRPAGLLMRPAQGRLRDGTPTRSRPLVCLSSWRGLVGGSQRRLTRHRPQR